MDDWNGLMLIYWSGYTVPLKSMEEYPMQKDSIKSMVVKYVCNVLIFAIVYSAVSVLLISLSVTGFLVNAVAVSIAVLVVITLMKRISPIIDKHLGNKSINKKP